MKAFTVLAILVLAIAGGLHAQSTNTSQISGMVQDQSGASVANAQVKVTQTDTGLVRQITSDASGSYILPNLPIGPYRLEATAEGFQTYVQTGIVLQVNVNPTISIIMQVGQVSQQVEVQSEAIQVETESTGVGQLVDNQSVLQLPLNGRVVTDLVLLSPATTLCNNCNGGFTGVRQYPTVGIQIAGGSPGGTYYSMDGSTHNDPGNNLNMAVPFPDALQEFKVETGAVPARYGQHANADVTLVTKSGTNNYHGDLFEFVRNGMFNAQNDFATQKDQLKRNQFGGTFGGPVLPRFKNKLFFFVGYQGTILRTLGTVNGSGTYIQDFIPTAAMYTGDFSGYASAACNPGKTLNANGLVQLTAPATSPYQFNSVDQINPLAFDPVATSLLADFPKSTNPCGTYQLFYPIPSTDKQYLGRVDYQISDKQSVFVRYFRAHNNQPYSTALAPDEGLNAVSDYIDNVSASLVGGHTYVFNPNFINSFRFSFLDEPNARTPAPYLNPTQAGSNMYSTPFGGPSTTLTVSNGFGLGGTAANNAVFNYHVFAGQDDIDMIRGSHQISYGVQILYESEFTHGTQYSNGVFSFNGSRSGLSLSDFMLGLSSNIQQGGDIVINDYKYYLGLYAQDSWKVIPRLTINYGMRWEPAFPIESATDHVMQFNEQNFINNVQSKVYVNSPPGFTYPGDAGYSGDGMTAKEWLIFSPRFGMVYDPTGKGKMAIRAAYGVFVDSQPLFDNFYVASNPPWGALVSINNVQLSNPYGPSSTYPTGYPGGDPFPFVLNSTIKFPLAGTYRVQQPKMNQEYTQQYNLSVERQMFSDWLFSVAYIGNGGRHLWSAVDINAPVGATSTGNEQAHRPLTALNPTWGPYISQLIMDNAGGTGNYNAMVISANKAFTHGYSIISNFTWSHCINDFDPHENTSASDEDPYNIAHTRGNCTGDLRKVLNLSGVVGTPKFNSHLVEQIAGNWQLSGIFTAQTGYYTSVTTTIDNALDGITGQYADLVPGVSPILAHPTTAEWFNRAAFQENAAGTFGDSGRNSVLGPGLWNINVALIRNFPILETHSLQFRAEAYNLFNHPNFGLPNGSLTSSTFGEITSAGDPRILQFAMKFAF
jgi:hypothetical protein